MKWSVREWREKYRETLAAIYPQEEVDALFVCICETILGLSRVEQQLRFEQVVNGEKEMQLQAVLDKLSAGHPLQYILHSAYFYDMELYVDSSVLIPRPETEELVHLILNDLQNDSLASILDIGTGSGCIPIAIKKNRLLTRVFALDVSPDAIAVAKRNAEIQQVTIEFVQQDILQSGQKMMPWLTTQLDVIVSNPPYVPNAEKSEMASHVLDHEPHLALFVEDQDPLVFYKAIAEFAKKELKSNGRLYFEIHADMGQMMVSMLLEKGFQEVQLFQDINGRDRMIRCVFRN